MEAAHMNLSETWQTWLRVTTAPGEPTFEAERQKPQATLTTALIWMLIAGIVAALLGFIQAAVAAGTAQSSIAQALAMADLPPESRAQLQQLFSSGVFGALGGSVSLASIIMVPVGFLVGTAIYFVIAKLLGGTGDFGRYAYLNASFSAPLTILSSIISVIPVIGCVSIFIGIYQIVLTYYSTKVEHNLTSGRALIVVLLPLLVVLLLVFCFVFFIVGALLTIPVQTN
jgi:Na+/proline symporter